MYLATDRPKRCLHLAWDAVCILHLPFISKADLTGEIKRCPNILYTEHTGKQTAGMCSSEPQLMFMNAAMELFFLYFSPLSP